MDGTQQPSNSGEFKPGDTISPAGAQPQPPQPIADPLPVAATPVAPEVQPLAPTVQPTYQQPEVITPHSVASPPTGPEGAISWTASEFVAHHKSRSWYVLLALVAFVFAAAVSFLPDGRISSVFILIAAALFGVFAARKPRDLGYQLDKSGLSIGARHFTYGEFRSFAVMREGAFSSIVFMPLKRFAVLITIYYDPADEAKIVDLLSERLPLEERSHDLLDQLMWRIRF